MNITAIVLTAGNYLRDWPGLQLVVQRQVITNAAEQLAARFSAISRVRTERFFFLDDDDDLPADYLDVLAECSAHGAPIVYTDELVLTPMNAPVGSVISKGPYSRERHYRNPTLLHHLVLCDTRAAITAIERLPRGHYWPEFLLYWELARSGAPYVPRVGYVWNKRERGMHLWPSTIGGQMRAILHARPEHIEGAVCASA